MFRKMAALKYFLVNIFRKRMSDKVDAWTLLNAVCVLAAFIQLAFILGKYTNPDQLNTTTSEISLSDMEFPLDIKICAEPAFNKKALFDAGFGKRSYHYFNGRSRFDPTVLGWAGLTKGSVEEVLDKVRNHKEDDVIEWIGFDFKNKTTGDDIV